MPEKLDTGTESQPTTVDQPTAADPPVAVNWWLVATASAVLPWLSQPPLRIWPITFVAVIPLLVAAGCERDTARPIGRRRWMTLYLAAFLYWATTLQGLRLANPLIYPCWLALAGYLAIYPLLFVAVLRRFCRLSVPLMIAAPLSWVGIECVRNYLLTGISAAMLGHTLADVPILIQVADLGGTYAVSLVIVMVNVGVYSTAAFIRRTRQSPTEADTENKLISSPLLNVMVALVVLLACASYGRFRMLQPVASSGTTFALIGRDEPVEYEQKRERELELFEAYYKQTLDVVSQADQRVHAIVWPESMFTGNIPWIDGKGNSQLADELGLPLDAVNDLIHQRRQEFHYRASTRLQKIAAANGNPEQPPHLIGGCGVVSYRDQSRAYSGVVHLAPSGQVNQWYGKTHLVMFGEYIPLVKRIPIVRSWVPKNLGLSAGDGPRLFQVGSTTVCPNLCIETAVERVSINHLRQLRRQGNGELPDVIVTVTNDGWFDDSSVVQHHKRCAQLVAVACRHPVLSAANNGPTAWIDSYGQVVQQLDQGANGGVIATPSQDHRTSLVMLIADWPARICALVSLAVLLSGLQLKRRERKGAGRKGAGRKGAGG